MSGRSARPDISPDASPDGSPDRDTLRIHATTVALGRHAVILRGASGAGKSDLALRFLAERARHCDGAFGNASEQAALALPRRLVADDQTLLRIEQNCLLASAPQTIAGRIEVRGIGILEVAFIAVAEVRLVVDLVTADAVDRYPLVSESETFLGCTISRRRLAPFEASAPLKLALLLAAVGRI